MSGEIPKFEANKGLKISSDVLEMGTENAFSVFKDVEIEEEKGRTISKLFIGEPDFDTPKYIKNFVIGLLKDENIKIGGYTSSAGLPELRRTIADFFERTRCIKVSPDSVVVDAGAKPFIGHAVKMITKNKPGSEILVPVPGYPIYGSQGEFEGCKLVPYFLREENDFEIDIDEFKSKVNGKTKLIILNSPHNPTGGVLSKRTLEEIAEIVLEQKNLWVFSDEIYSNFVFDGKSQSIASVCEEMQERTIMVDSASKTLAMPGWRIGFMSNMLLAKYFANFVTNSTSCAPRISQRAVAFGFQGLLVEEYAREIEYMKEQFKERSVLITDELNSLSDFGISCKKPKGAFYAWPNVTKLCESVGITKYCSNENLKLSEKGELCDETMYYPSEVLRKRLLNEAGVAVLADIHFGSKVPGEGEYLRFSYAASCDKIKEGVLRIKDWVEKNLK